ncbi:polyprenol monophosphomannose synthase [Nocardioides scoriae]|uniref:polyprenol monophosphomannose synthase n=1 Tax=Nocardioides scoriae TaxID=642780 RepID=UPI002F91B86B
MPSELPARNLVVIPTYDEIDNLEHVVARTLAVHPSLDVLVVDDNSPDGTGRLADVLAQRSGRVHVLHRAGKQGLGAAYLAGFGWALDRDYDTVAELDADGSHQPEQLTRLFAALPGADLVLGSRWVRGGGVENWPKRREVLSRGGNWYTRRALRLPLRDATGGFRVFRSDALRALDLGDVSSHGYCFQVDLARRAVRSGMAVVEVPIDFREREHGVSKMSGSIVREALWRVTVWGVQDRMRPAAPPGRHRLPERQRR